MPDRSIGGFLTGSRDGPSRGDRSSCSSITSTPTHRTSCPMEPGPASAECRSPRMSAGSSTTTGPTSTSRTCRKHYLNLARDSYDNCLAYLDEQLGHLFDELQRRGVLDRTLVVITSDHGEGLGEHDLFDHGESLYSTEIRVPLLILPPSGGSSGAVVQETVSLRDLPATIVDLVGLGKEAPFPGRSLASLWRDSSPGIVSERGDVVISELREPNPLKPNQGRSPATNGPLISLAEGDFVYIRNERDGTEELFNERDDPRELTNRVRVDVLKPVLERFRKRLAEIKSNAAEVAR